MNKITSTLHDATHEVPGVPEHRDNQPHQPHRNPSSPHAQPKSSNTNRNQRPPRVLVAWQNWIARRTAGRAAQTEHRN